MNRAAVALSRLRQSLPFSVYGKAARALSARMPKGLYARSLMIIVLPMVILQSVVAFVFMERHWETVTRRLSSAVTGDIAAVIDIIETYPQDPDYATISDIARARFDLGISMLPPGPLPPTGPKPFFSLLDRTMSTEITAQIGKPFWIDTVGRSSLFEIRILLDQGVLRVFARRSRAYASNSHIFLVWMVGTSLVLLTVAILFLRNQIRPILQLAEAAEGFGKGRDSPDFRPRGAVEVRRASHAFIEMKTRIERQIEQRTAMLAGVSHDLRTVLTRFRLQLELIEQTADVEELKRDVDEMSAMLDAYLAFARGDAGEATELIDLPSLLAEIAEETQRGGTEITLYFSGEPSAQVRPGGLKRCLTNLVSNAARFGERVAIAGHHDQDWLTFTVDDDGPGLDEADFEVVFRPFFRLDHARNQDTGGSGLGLAIARDLARGHGGDIVLDRSPLGGLRAIVRIPA